MIMILCEVLNRFNRLGVILTHAPSDRAEQVRADYTSGCNAGIPPVTAV